MIWSAVENHLAVFIACAPAIRMFLVQVLPRARDGGSVMYNRLLSKLGRSTNNSSAHGGSGRVSRFLQTHQSHNTSIASFQDTDAAKISSAASAHAASVRAMAMEQCRSNQAMQPVRTSWMRKGSTATGPPPRHVNPLRKAWARMRGRSLSKPETVHGLNSLAFPEDQAMPLPTFQRVAQEPETKLSQDQKISSESVCYSEYGFGHGESFDLSSSLLGT